MPAQKPEPDFLLPLEKYCYESLDKQLIKKLNLDRQNECELSRLAVDQSFRRRPGEQMSRFGSLTVLDVPESERRTFQLVAVSAFVAAIALTELSGRNSVFAMMEPFFTPLAKKIRH